MGNGSGARNIHQHVTPLVRFTAFGSMDPTELVFLNELVERSRKVAISAKSPLRATFRADRGVFVLQSGWVSSAIVMDTGEQQIVKIHLPGDVVDAPSLAVKESSALLTALTPVVARFVPELELQRLFAQCPALAYRLFLGAQQERLALMDRLAASGQLSAKRSVAAFIVDLHHRMRISGLTNDSRVQIPVSQAQIAQIVGLSTVHVNRSLKALQGEGLMLKIKGGFDLVHLDELKHLARVQDRAAAIIDTSLFHAR